MSTATIAVKNQRHALSVNCYRASPATRTAQPANTTPSVQQPQRPSFFTALLRALSAFAA